MGNTKKIQEVLMNSIFEVFEKMFFVFLEPLDEDVKYDMISSINFVGPLKGEIKLLFAEGLAQSMVQNMLSLNRKDITEKMIEDCTKEAANMVGGNFLQKLDSAKVFDLSIPVFEKKTGVFVSKINNQSEAILDLAFESEGNHMAVSVSVYAGEQ
jgi:CheY-specific phosphatase CheX